MVFLAYDVSPRRRHWRYTSAVWFCLGTSQLKPDQPLIPGTPSFLLHPSASHGSPKAQVHEAWNSYTASWFAAQNKLSWCPKNHLVHYPGVGTNLDTDWTPPTTKSEAKPHQAAAVAKCLSSNRSLQCSELRSIWLSLCPPAAQRTRTCSEKL